MSNIKRLLAILIFIGFDIFSVNAQTLPFSGGQDAFISSSGKDQDIFVPLFYCLDDKSNPAKRDNIQIPNEFSTWPALVNGLLLKPVAIWVGTPEYPQK